MSETMRALRVHRTGGPEVMELESAPVQTPGPGQARIRVAYAGVNYIDVYHRTGAYPLPLPLTPGSEGAGSVEAVGEGVSGLAVGDRVAWAMQPGSYAEQVVVSAAQLVPVPAGVGLDVAAASMLQGMTAHYLTHSTFPIQDGNVALVHAAAGGVGLLLTQIAKKRGATVIGTVSTQEKAALARQAGADEIVLHTRASFKDVARRANGGKGVDVVYDSVGRTTFEESLDSLRPRGLMVLFGASSGPVPPIEAGLLNRKGSLFFTRPGLAHHVADRKELLWRSGDVFAWIADGSLSVRIDRVLPLERAAEAHRLLEGRATAGKVLLAC